MSRRSARARARQEFADELLPYAVTAEDEELLGGDIATGRECGCSELAACPGGCIWVEPDLCSHCARAS